MPIALLLMDQRVSAGVGNIFRAEVLYRHRLDPMMAGSAAASGGMELAVLADLVGLMYYAGRPGPDRFGAS